MKKDKGCRVEIYVPTHRTERDGWGTLSFGLIEMVKSNDNG
jgi:hypothetical protein